MPPETAETPAAVEPAPPPAAAPAAAYSPLAALRRPPVLIAVIALALLGWQWAETRVRLTDVREELAKRLSEGDAVA